MINDYELAALTAERRKTFMKDAADSRLRRQARLGASKPNLTTPGWTARIRAWTGFGLNKATVRPSAVDTLIPTMREYRERPASDTSTIKIRPIDGNDVFLLADGFARLSDRSRQLRFLGAKSSLSPAELDHLTNVDHRNAEAIVALSVADGRGIGVARYTRDPHDPGAAEVAVTVVDEWHRRGIGGELTNRLISRARGQGINRFTALVSDDNVACIKLLHSLGLDVTVIERDHHATEYEISLSDAKSRH